jgi:FAD:protein FMN transferase
MEVVEHHGRVMASVLHIIVVGPPAEPTADHQSVRELRLAGGASVHERSVLAEHLEDAVHDVVAYLDHLERCWSRFISTSDISRINTLGSAGGGPITVDNSTLSLLATMVEGYQCTAGRFDPTVLRAVISQGYAASHVDPTLVSTVAEPFAHPSPASLHDVELDPSTNTVVVPDGLVLDAGGIGKGLAADLAVARLLAAGVAGAMVEIGGDLAMAGTPVDPAGWLVNVERPDPADGILCSLAISGGGIATSSTRSRRWVLDGLERHHQIDPGTEQCSTTDIDAVTVIAPTGWLAEVHATAALGVGSSEVLAYLDGHGLSGIAVVRGAASDSVVLTAGLADVELRPRTRVR